MKIIKWIWWLGSPLFAAFCIGYGIAFAGWGFSWWSKPEPDAFITTVAFLSAGVAAINESVKDARHLMRKTPVTRG